MLSTVSGETDVTTQWISEQMDMLRAGKLKPIAILADADVDVPGGGLVPSVASALQNLSLAPICFGVFMPGDVSAKIEAAWSSLAESRALKDYTKGRGSIVTVHAGEDAQMKVWPSIQLNAWLLHDSGASTTSPDALGIPRP